MDLTQLTPDQLNALARRLAGWPVELPKQCPRCGLRLWHATSTLAACVTGRCDYRLALAMPATDMLAALELEADVERRGIEEMYSFQLFHVLFSDGGNPIMQRWRVRRATPEQVTRAYIQARLATDPEAAREVGNG